MYRNATTSLNLLPNFVSGDEEVIATMLPTEFCIEQVARIYFREALADLGFLRGGGFGNRSEQSERAFRGSALTGE